MNSAIHAIPYVVALMTFWDFTIHVIDKRDRNYRLNNQMHEMWSQKLKDSSLFVSYYYPFFWGKKKQVGAEEGWKRYDYFWVAYWGLATVSLFVYVIFR